MKKLIIMSILSVLLMACNNNYSDALETYLTVNDGVKTDLEFKLLESKLVQEVLAADSLRVCKYYRDSHRESKMESSKSLIEMYEGLIRDNLTDMKYESEYMKTYYRELINEYKEQIKELEDEYKNYETNNFAFEDDERIKKYSEMDSTEVIAHVVECRYSIINPLTKLKQEVTKKYIFSPDGKTCYKSY